MAKMKNMKRLNTRAMYYQNEEWDKPKMTTYEDRKLEDVKELLDNDPSVVLIRLVETYSETRVWRNQYDK